MHGGAAKTEAVVLVGGTRHPVPPQGLRVGRAPDNDVVLDDVNVSRQHLVIWSTPSGVYLRDLGSQNGTYIDARRVGPGPEALPPGARVRIGRSELLVEQRPVAPIGESGPPRPADATRRARPAQRGSSPAADAGRRAGPRSRAGLLVGGGVGLVVLGLLGLTSWAVFRAATSGPAAERARAQTAPGPTAAPAPPFGGALGASPSPVVIGPAGAAGGAQPAGSLASTDSRDPGLVRALGAAVRVLVPTGPNQGNAGSGTVVSARGHVLTNYHVVSDETTRRLINDGNAVVIAVPPSEGEPARPKFVARVVESDQRLDFALLRIVALAGGGALPADLGLAPVPVGDSDVVRIGDPLTIVGYPQLGGQGVTVTRGIHSGIQTFPNEVGTFFKTDTEINPGNSGGTAIDAAGRLVGVPTAGRVSREGLGKIGLVRPINLARPLIERADQDR